MIRGGNRILVPDADPIMLKLFRHILVAPRCTRVELRDRGLSAIEFIASTARVGVPRSVQTKCPRPPSWPANCSITSSARRVSLPAAL